jgi:hypothetical protein
MAKLFDNRIIDKAVLASKTVSYLPTGHGEPNAWMVTATFTFYCKDKAGQPIGIMQSGSGESNIPFFIIADGLMEEPSYQQISDLEALAKERMDLFVAEQIYNISGEVMPDFELVEDKIMSKRIPYEERSYVRWAQVMNGIFPKKKVALEELDQ